MGWTKTESWRRARKLLILPYRMNAERWWEKVTRLASEVPLPSA